MHGLAIGFKARFILVLIITARCLERSDALRVQTKCERIGLPCRLLGISENLTPRVANDCVLHAIVLRVCVHHLS